MTSLRKFRYDKGLQRKFVADQIGICGKHLNDVEIAKANLTDNIAQRLAQVYGVEVEKIKSMYEGENNEK